MEPRGNTFQGTRVLVTMTRTAKKVRGATPLVTKDNLYVHSLQLAGASVVLNLLVPSEELAGEDVDADAAHVTDGVPQPVK